MAGSGSVTSGLRGLHVLPALATVGLLALARPAGAYNNGLGRVPPLGQTTWCVDDLTCGILDYCTEEELHGMIDAMKTSGMVEAGFKWTLLDDCWASTERTAEGKIQPAKDQFPSGMPALVQYAESAGLNLGLYTCAGNETCRWGRTGSGSHLESDAGTFASWGVKMIKEDNCGHPSEPQSEYYGNMSHWLNHTGSAIHFNLCGWGEQDPASWAPAISQSHRIGLDHLPLWRYETLELEMRLWDAQRQGIDVGSLRVPGLTAEHLEEEEGKRRSRELWHAKLVGAGSSLGQWLESLKGRLDSSLGQGTYDIIQEMANLSATTLPYSKADPDFTMTLLVDFLTPFVDSQTEWSFWCLWGGNLLMATTPVNMSDAKRSIVLNTEALDVHQDAMAPPGRRLAVRGDKTELWSRAMSDGSTVAIVFNPLETNSTTTLSWAELGLKSTPSTVRDIWAHADVAPVPPSLSRTLRPHEVMMLRVHG